MVRIPMVFILPLNANVNLRFPLAHIRQISAISLKRCYVFQSPLMLFYCFREAYSTLCEGLPSEESCPHNLATLTTADCIRGGLLTQPPDNKVVGFQSIDFGGG